MIKKFFAFLLFINFSMFLDAMEMRRKDRDLSAMERGERQGRHRQQKIVQPLENEETSCGECAATCIAGLTLGTFVTYLIWDSFQDGYNLDDLCHAAGSVVTISAIGANIGRNVYILSKEKKIN